MAEKTQAELEALYAEQDRIRSQHTITIINGLIDNKLGIHNVDFDALAAQVKSLDELLDGDPDSEGYQKFAALSLKLNNVEATSTNNAQSIANLQNALNTQISTLSGRVDTVESEARTGREALDVRISSLASQYETHVANVLVKNNQQDTRLDDHQERIAALEASKVLSEQRIVALEADNTTNKSDISQIKTTLQTHASALEQELQRAQQAEASLRGELVTERERVDGLVTASGDFLTRQQAADAHTAGSMAYCNGLYAFANIQMPAGLALPDGTTSS